MSKKLLFALFISSLLAGPLPAAAAADTSAGKIAVVDFQRCLNESRTGKRYKEEFSGKAQQAQAELEKKETALKELRETLEKQGLVLSPAARAEKEKDYREKLESFREQFRTTQQALQRQDQELTGRITRDLQLIARKLGETGNYALIIERQEAGVIYAGKVIDLTDELIRRYDEEAEAKTKTEERK